MSILAEPIDPALARHDDDEAGVRPVTSLLGIGTAVPEMVWPQHACEQQMAAIWGLSGDALSRWRRIVEGSGIEQRHAVLSPEIVTSMSTGERMQAYERLAPPLALDAARKAIASAGCAHKFITDVVLVSCTGFSAPGVDAALINQLGLSPTTRRTTVGFMGCFGAINGLRVASGLCAADPDAVALLVCVELCSLHMRSDAGTQNQVASALFADGAAAAILTGARAGVHLATCTKVSDPIARIGRAASLVLQQGREWMTWRITDAGFAMTLSREVPAALRRSIRGFLHDNRVPTDAALIVHPGGPGVLDAIESAMDLRGSHALLDARDILRRCGNMSSATVLFVLEEALRRGASMPAMLLAFGPGLTIEGLLLEAP